MNLNPFGMNSLPSQSALETAGSGAAQIAQLFYVMVAGAVVIWAVVIGLAVYALWRPGRHDPRSTRLLVIGGGAVMPTVVLTGLLFYGLSFLPELQRPAPEGSQVIDVSGARFWWRVAYRLPDGRSVEAANEIHLPAGEAVEFKLTSEDVIHSFWIPSLGGKVDMIPSRENRLKLHPQVPGRYRGVCAEFCGASHAHMAFDVVVHPRERFDRVLAELAQPATPPEDPQARAGQAAFLSLGCGACHQIRGTQAAGRLGPDLTHFGSRLSIGAGELRNTPENLRHWITRTHDIKPGVEMPAFENLEADELDALVAYLEHLR